MQDYTFIGRVHPERASLTISEPTTIEGRKENGDQIYSLVIHIYANQIMVRAKISEELGFDFPTMKNFVTEHVESVIDFCSYLYQTGYEVEITSAINIETNNAETFGVRLQITDEDLEVRAKRFSRLLPALTHSPRVSLALSDIRAAIRTPRDTGVHCYRAFESILHDFELGAKKGKKAKYGLNHMAKDLNIGSGRSLKTFLGRYAGERRHGDAVSITWQDRKAVMVRIWTLMDRYLEYLIRGRKPLPHKEFPQPDFSKL